MWPQKGLIKRMTGRKSQGIEGYGRGPLWRRRPTLGCSASEEEDMYINSQPTGEYLWWA
jgi:hypothetical protein